MSALTGVEEKGKSGRTNNLENIRIEAKNVIRLHRRIVSSRFSCFAFQLCEC